MFKYFYIVTLT